VTLQEYCNSLSEKQKLALSIMLIKIALPVWEKYSKKNKLTYRDSIVLLKHSVNKNLLHDVISEAEDILNNLDSSKTVEGKERIKTLYKDFSDPVTALQDDDWELPRDVEKIFYSAYNLLNAIIFGDENTNGESSYYISANMAIDVIGSEKFITEEEIKSILKNIKLKL
jgi:hypothetical protein